MTQQTFIADVLDDARTASQKTRLPVSVIVAQWAVETGWGTSYAWVIGHNYAGVSPGGHVAHYPDRKAGLTAYISTLLSHYYTAAREASDAHAAAVALGQSPWAASHYDSGAGPGSLLLEVIGQYQLTGYDGGTVTPKPVVKTSHPYPGHTLQEGSQGDDVKLVQGVVGTDVDGDFGPLTKAAVIHWQQTHGLYGNGIVGPHTWASLWK